MSVESFLQGWTLWAAAITSTGAAGAVLWKLAKGTERVAARARTAATEALGEALEPKIASVVSEAMQSDEVLQSIDDRVNRALEPVRVDVTKMAATLAVIAELIPALAELLPNGGSSVKDQVTKLYEAMTRDHRYDPPEGTPI